MVRYSVLLAAAAFIGVTLAPPPASAAKYMKYRWSPSRSWESPERNNYLSARYDYLLQTNRRFRAYRIWKECHTITIPPLRADCIASFDQYEPVLASYRWR